MKITKAPSGDFIFARRDVRITCDGNEKLVFSLPTTDNMSAGECEFVALDTYVRARFRDHLRPGAVTVSREVDHARATIGDCVFVARVVE